MMLIEFGSAIASAEGIASGQGYKYNFNIYDLIKPIPVIIAGCGWIYKGVEFGNLEYFFHLSPGKNILVIISSSPLSVSYSCLRMTGRNIQEAIAIPIRIVALNTTVRGSDNF